MSSPFKIRSTAALLSAITGTLLLVVDIAAFSSLFGNVSLAGLLAVVHQSLLALGALFAWLGYAKRSPGMLLAAGILFAAALLILYMYFYLYAIPMILAFIGFANQRSLNSRGQ